MRTTTLIFAATTLLSMSVMGPLLADEAPTPRPYLGVQLEEQGPSEILRRHLQLAPGQGVIVRQVRENGPADEAGIEPYDVIVGLDGSPVGDVSAFAAAIRAEQVGADIELNVIHAGEPKTISVRLGELPAHALANVVPDPFGDPEVQLGVPYSRVFRLGPSGEGERLYTEVVRRQSPRGTVTYEVTIEGDPNDVDALITVVQGASSYQTTIGEVAALPEDIRELAEQAIKNARGAGTSDELFSMRGIGAELEALRRAQKRQMEELEKRFDERLRKGGTFPWPDPGGEPLKL